MAASGLQQCDPLQTGCLHSHRKYTDIRFTIIEQGASHRSSRADAGLPATSRETAMQILPDFLISGAMKAGTTTLYYDLLGNPDIFFPVDKEVNALLDPDVTTPAGRQCYQWFYRTSQPHQLRGDASTAYTMRPTHEGVARRAATVLPGSLKIIYLVREPVARIVSHFQHERAAGRIRCNINQAVRQHPRLIDYTRYAWQIQPWIKQFGAAQVRIVVFEEFIARRQQVTGSICDFLGVKHRAAAVDAARVYNRSQSKPLEKGVFFAMSSHPLYRGWIRPLISQRVREKMRRAVLPRDNATRPQPAPETLDYIRQQLAGDHEQLRLLMRRGQPLWDSTRVCSTRQAG